MVIGVLAVLLAILLPVFRNARTATLRTRARVQATALGQAVEQYKNLYGYWPGAVTEDGGKLKQNTDALTYGALNTPLVCRGSNDWFDVLVRNADGSRRDVNHIPRGDNTLYRSLLPFDIRYSGDKNRNPLNPNRVRLIELKAEETPLAATLSDPWDKEFCVVMGLDPARLTTLYDGTWPIISFSNQTAAVLSRQQLRAAGPQTYLYFLSAGITNGFIRRVN